MEAEADDDMIVIIVDNDQPTQERTMTDDAKCPALLKDLIETAKKYGQHLKVESSESEDIQIQLSSNEEDDGDVCVEEPKQIKRKKLLKPSQWKSFVNELRNERPELAEDDNLLVEALAKKMSDEEPPPPPENFYVPNGNLFACTTCGASFISVLATTRHYEDVHGPRYLNCYACGVDFRSKRNLYRHEKQCVATDAEIALRARALYIGAKTRTTPFVNEAKVISKKFKCKICPAQFKTQVHLTAHQHAHRGERPYTCKICPRGYTSLSALSRHKKDHREAKFFCKQCDRGFKTTELLEKHKEIHLGQKLHECLECGRQFAQKRVLALHVNSEHNNKKDKNRRRS